MSIHKRGKHWYAYIRDPRTGRQVTRSLKTTSKREAERRHALLLAEIAKQGVEAVAGKMTVSELLNRYLEWSRANKRSWRRDVTSARALDKRLGSLRLRDLSPLQIERYKNQRSKEVTNSSVNRELALLRHAYNQARAWGLYAGENPMSHVRMFRENPSRLRYLSKEEWDRLYEEALPEIKPLLLCLVSTGLRIGEALSLTWRNVDLSGHVIHISDSKGGRPRDVPIPKALLRVLMQLKQKRTSEEVFPLKEQWVRRRFYDACRRAGIDGLWLHDLRHTYASWQVMAGTPIRTLQELLGHKTIAMTMKYSHLAPSHIQASARAIDDVMG